MAKKFYTEKDIEDLFQNGVKALEIRDEVVLTELAYEKAKRLGLQLVFDDADTPPAAPVRPYLSEGQRFPSKPIAASFSPAASQPKPALTPALSQGERENTTDIEKRIRSAVIARLGTQVDAKLLDNIIHRVVKATGLK